ncbi:hypothetical protein [Thermoflexus sp.]|uniref:hypothetical protein n=1 Tax=Thermoflexus sp. TaxID=1969742 RepID=UPI0035E44B58
MSRSLSARRAVMLAMAFLLGAAIFSGIWRVEGWGGEPDPAPTNNISEASLLLRRYINFLPLVARFSTP